MNWPLKVGLALTVEQFWITDFWGALPIDKASVFF